MSATQFPERPDNEALDLLIDRGARRRNPFLQVSAHLDVVAVLERLRGFPRSGWAAVLTEAAQALPHSSLAERIDRFALLQVARYPSASTPERREAYALMRDAFDEVVELLEPPTRIERFTSDAGEIAAVVAVPNDATAVVLVCAGLDMWKEDAFMAFGRFHVESGRAVVVIDAPGTGEAPVAMSPEADGYLDAVLGWIETELPALPLLMHGISLGGHWAARAAHVFSDRFVGVVDQGGPADATFGREWLEHWTEGEYPFEFITALQTATRTSDDDQLTAALARLSFTSGGLIDGPCAPLLLVNGVHDRTALFDDTLLLTRHGAPKSARFFPGGHMGMTPQTLPTIGLWVEAAVSRAR